jgi:hypothetical protein
MCRAAWIVVLTAALLSGCNSDAAEPAPLPSVDASGLAESSPSPSPSPTPAVEAVPPAAQEPTPDGAAAFARFFYAAVTRGYAEKDPEVVQQLSAPGCSACERFVASMTALRDDGETVTPVVYNIVSAEAPGFDGTKARVDVMYNSPEIVRRDRSGNIIRTEPDVTGFLEQLTLVRGPSGWLVQGVDVV